MAAVGAAALISAFGGLGISAYQAKRSLDILEKQGKSKPKPKRKSKAKSKSKSKPTSSASKKYFNQALISSVTGFPSGRHGVLV